MARSSQNVASSSVTLALVVLSIQPLRTLSSVGEHAYAWAGIFSTTESTYLWTAQKVKSFSGVKYANATMKMVVLPASAATETQLNELKDSGETALRWATCGEVLSGGTITPEANKCYNLKFKEEWWQSLYTINNAANHAALAFFTQHVPTEFENTAHYLKDDHGDDIEPVAELPENEAARVATTAAPEEKEYWGEGILVSLIVNLVTLAGVVFVLPGIKTMSETYREEFECVVSAFAGGAISACAFFLLLFESAHLIAVTEEEVDVSWRWGTMFLAGALFPTVVHAITEIATKPSSAAAKGSDVEKGSEVAIPVTISRPRLISSVLIGDFMHNMCDGFLIGAAFKGGGASIGWTVAWSTVGHEFAQELGDYLVLTGNECALHPAIALALNFLSGTGTMLACLIVLSTKVEDVELGLILAFGGGVYLNIAINAWRNFKIRKFQASCVPSASSCS